MQYLDELGNSVPGMLALISMIFWLHFFVCITLYSTCVYQNNSLIETWKFKCYCTQFCLQLRNGRIFHRLRIHLCSNNLSFLFGDDLFKIWKCLFPYYRYRMNAPEIQVCECFKVLSILQFLRVTVSVNLFLAS